MRSRKNTFGNLPDKGYKQPQKKPFFTPTRVLVGGLALGAIGFGIYKYFDWMGQQKSGERGLTLPDDPGNLMPAPPSEPPAGTTKPKSSITNTIASGFPIKRGSRGEKVKQLQEALIAKYGKAIMPKYGADGVYGSELEKALKDKNLPTTIDEQQFLILTSVDTSDTATKLFNAATKKDFNAAIAAVRTLRNTNDYKTVSEAFKAKRLNSVSTTLVTGMLNTFPDPAQKQQFQIEFSRIGLKYDGSKWSVPEGVAGLPSRQLVTSKPTTVWANARNQLSVGANVVLGREIASSGGITLFDTVDGFRLFVLTCNVCYM